MPTPYFDPDDPDAIITEAEAAAFEAEFAQLKQQTAELKARLARYDAESSALLKRAKRRGKMVVLRPRPGA